MAQRSLTALRRDAARSTAWRGHRMKWTYPLRWGLSGRELAVGVCRRCGMEVCCDPKPEANGIDIGGEAVALNCKGRS
jgi:hypothetical protein